MSLFRVRLLDAIHMKGTTAAELSRKTNISESNISRYLSGSSEPSLRSLLILANALGVSADWLSGNEEEEEEEKSFEVMYGEKDLMSMYSKLSMTGKQKVLEYTEMVLALERRNV